MDPSSKIYIFDTTLRDGEQALAQSLDVKQKLQIAKQLDLLGVDYIEAGFPISSEGDFQAVRQIGQNLQQAIPCGLSRAIETDIDACAQALSSARAFRIHTFIATSDIHIKDKLRKNNHQIIEMATRAIQYARRFTDDVEFSCEDAGRTSIDYLCQMIEQAIKAGARTINIPDTVGYTFPYEFGHIIESIFNRVPNIDLARVSVHCHNDLGMATANSLSAIMKGARQIECCMNGLGERAGNCALEEVVMAIKLRQNYLNGLYTTIDTSSISRVSNTVSKICNEPVASHKPIVGSNAFSHSSGIHQDGVLKNRNTYEILTPESIGLNKNTMHMTARSGRHMVKACLTNLGYPENSYDLNDIYNRFLEVADRKGQVFDYDLEALLFFHSIDQDEDNTYKLDAMNVMSGGSKTIPTASVRLKVGKRLRTLSSTGNGPIDAVYNCITKLTGLNCELLSYTINANGAGMDALGQVDVTVSYEGRTFHGMGLSTDVIEASALALIHACNNIERAKCVQKQRQLQDTQKGNTP